jgi:long-chain acyl-CoA synthetase
VDVQFLFLPLSHVFAKVLEMSFIRLGIPTVVDGNVDELMSNLCDARPTWLAAVPRIFEKARDAILDDVAKRPLPQRRLFDWALRIGRRASAKRQQGRRPRGILRAKLALADRLVLREIRERFGGRIRFMISGGAPLSKEVAEFFDALGLLILEGYGLTESAAATCVNRPDDVRFGSVGKPLPDCDVRIDDDGEILIKSRGVMKGYWGLDEETHRVLTNDGWLRTGDIGVVHHSGHVEITGRKKEFIVTANGKNIAPAHFEELLRNRCPYVQHALLHGDRRPYCVALVTLDLKAATRWAREHGVPDDPATLHTRPEIRELIQDYVDAVHRDLPPWEHARRTAILAEDFTLENGMLTPSLKVKRRVVEARYADVLDGLYTP